MASSMQENVIADQESQRGVSTIFMDDNDPRQESRTDGQKLMQEEFYDHKNDLINKNRRRVKNFCEITRKQMKETKTGPNFCMESQDMCSKMKDKTDRERKEITDHRSDDHLLNSFTSCEGEAVFRQTPSLEDDYLQIALSIERHNATGDTNWIPVERSKDIVDKMTRRPTQQKAEVQNDLQQPRGKHSRQVGNRAMNRSYHSTDNVPAGPYYRLPYAFALPKTQKEKHHQNFPQMTFRDGSILQGGETYGAHPLLQLRMRSENIEDARLAKSLFQTIDELKKTVENIAFDRRGIKKKYGRVLEENIALTEQCRQLYAYNLQLKQELKQQTDNLKLSQQHQIKALRDVVEEKQKRLEIYQDRMLLIPPACNDNKNGDRRQLKKNTLNHQQDPSIETSNEGQAQLKTNSVQRDTFRIKKRATLKCLEERNDKEQNNQLYELNDGLKDITDEIKDLKQRLNQLDQFMRSQNTEDSNQVEVSHSKTSKTNNVRDIDGLETRASPRIPIIEMMTLTAARPPFFSTPSRGVTIQEIFSSEEDTDGTGETSKKRGDRLTEERSISEEEHREDGNDAARVEEEDFGCYLPLHVNHIITQTQATTGNCERRHIQNASIPIVQFLVNNSDCKEINDDPVPQRDQKNDGLEVVCQNVDSGRVVAVSTNKNEDINDKIVNKFQHAVDAKSLREQVQVNQDSYDENECEQQQEYGQISEELSSSLISPTVRFRLSLEEEQSDENTPAWKVEGNIEQDVAELIGRNQYDVTNHRHGSSDDIEQMTGERRFVSEPINKQAKLPATTENSQQQQTSARPTIRTFGGHRDQEAVVDGQRYTSSEHQNILKHQTTHQNIKAETWENSTFEGQNKKELEYQYQMAHGFNKDWESIQPSTNLNQMLTDLQQNAQDWDESTKKQVFQCLLKESKSVTLTPTPLAEVIVKDAKASVNCQQNNAAAGNGYRQGLKGSCHDTRANNLNECSRQFVFKAEQKQPPFDNNPNNFQQSKNSTSAGAGYLTPTEAVGKVAASCGVGSFLTALQQTPTKNTPPLKQENQDAFGNFVFRGSTNLPLQYQTRTTSESHQSPGGRATREVDSEQRTLNKLASEESPTRQQLDPRGSQQHEHYSPLPQQQPRQMKWRETNAQHRAQERKRKPTQQQKQQFWLEALPLMYQDEQMYQQQELQKQRIQLLQHLGRTQKVSPSNQQLPTRFQTSQLNSQRPTNMQENLLQLNVVPCDQNPQRTILVASEPIRVGQQGHPPFLVSPAGQGSARPPTASLSSSKPKQSPVIQTDKRPVTRTSKKQWRV